jgi:hypothetical protein
MRVPLRMRNATTIFLYRPYALRSASFLAMKHLREDGSAAPQCMDLSFAHNHNQCSEIGGSHGRHARKHTLLDVSEWAGFRP